MSVSEYGAFSVVHFRPSNLSDFQIFRFPFQHVARGEKEPLPEQDREVEPEVRPFGLPTSSRAQAFISAEPNSDRLRTTNVWLTPCKFCDALNSSELLHNSSVSVHLESQTYFQRIISHKKAADECRREPVNWPTCLPF